MRALCHGGLTLIELLAVLVVAGIVIGLAWPGFSALIADTRRVAHVNDVVRALQQARQASIYRARPVAVCPSRDGISCTRDWTQGKLLFVVERGWRPSQDIAEDNRLSWSPPVRGAVSIEANRNRFTFRPFRKRSTNGTLIVCDPAGRAAGRAIVVSPTGRVRTSADLPDWAGQHCPG